MHPTDGQVLLSTDAQQIGRVQRDEDYFRQGQQALYVSPVVHSADNEAPVLVVSAPIQGEGDELLAVVAVEMNLTDLETALDSRAGLGSTGRTYLIDAFGFYVTLPPDFADSPLHTIAKSEGVSRALAQQTGNGTYLDPRGVQVVGVYRWLPESRLGLLVEMEEAELTGQIKSTWMLITLSILGTLVLAIIAARSLTNWLVTPLKKIVATARALQTGDFSHRASFGGSDEISQLSTAFNEMADSLQHSQESLEQLVEQRTAELRMANEQLKQEIAERKQAEEALRESEERYRILAENSPDGIFVSDAERLIYINPRVCEITGFTRDELMNMKDPVGSLFAPEDQERVLAYAQSRLSGKPTPAGYEARGIRKDGEKVLFRLTVSSTVLSGGRVLQGTLEDITKRKRAEEALRAYSERMEEMVEARTTALTLTNAQLQQEIAERKQAEEALRLQSQIAGNMAEGVQLTRSDDGGIIYTNPRFEEMFGYGQGELIGKHVSVLNAPGDRSPEETAEEIVKSLNETSVWYGEVHNIKKDGTPFWCRASVSTLEHADHGKIWIAVHEDITEHKELQERLIRHEKLAVLGQLAGSVAHELRNPLGVLINAIYFLNLTLTEADDTTREYLEMISTQVRKADKIISDLLSFSRTRLDERAEREVVAISGLVTQVLVEQPPPEQVEVSTQIDPDLPPVFVDPQQMGQVLTNLVTNAYQAMSEGGKLTIKVEEAENQVRLSVIDTGGGIPEENMTKLFEPFFTTKPKGIGLGLAVSKNLAEANGGRIKVESNEGEGSTFTVTIPTKEMAA
jgi:PAS domain S-box-containing protein